MFPLASFCGLLTIHVGVAALSGVFLTLAAAVLAANVFDCGVHEDGWPIPLVLLIIFVQGLVLVDFLTFVSCYKENRSWALAGLVALVVWFLYWLVLCSLSFLSDSDVVTRVCVKLRCPETFWIANLRYRTSHYDKYLERTPSTASGPSTHPTLPSNYERDHGGDSRHRRDSGNNQDSGKAIEATTVFCTQTTSTVNCNDKHKRPTKTHRGNSTDALNKKDSCADTGRIGFQNPGDDYLVDISSIEDTSAPEEERQVVGLPMVGALVLFALNFMFVMFSALVLWSWASQLHYGDYYYT